MTTYSSFIASRSQLSGMFGFAPVFMPDFLFDFQRALVDWSIRRGKSAMFADCGLGKSPMQLVWAENIVRHTNRPVLIATPLAVSYQVIREAEKFGIEAVRCSDGKVSAGARIVVTNYERLDKFTSSDFSGMVCDESSILKNFDGARKAIVTEMTRTMKYRLLCTATAAPNDFTELGTSSEALGELGHIDMLNRFFKNDQNTSDTAGRWKGHAAPRVHVGPGWRFKGHAEEPFWKWVCSWARAVRKPSDIGFDDGRFVLPPISETVHIVEAKTTRAGMLFDVPASNLQEEREERRRTITERCERIAELVKDSDQALVWCHLNDEGKTLARIIQGAVEVSGADDDETKEERLIAFAEGKVRVLVTKPKIGAWGLNLQNCSHVTFFPSHSYEQFYQGVRRCWRFGQTKTVRVDIVGTDGEVAAIDSMKRKADQSDRMFSSMLRNMNHSLSLNRQSRPPTEQEIPSWIK